MDLTLLAGEIARFFFMKASEGAIEKIGEDFTTNLYKLKGIIQDWLQTRARGKEAAENPDILEAEIIEEFSNNPNNPLKGKLESLVEELRQVEGNNITATQTNKWGNNQTIGSMKGGNAVAGNQTNLDQRKFFR
jgi:hypothetical protein